MKKPQANRHHETTCQAVGGVAAVASFGFFGGFHMLVAGISIDPMAPVVLIPLAIGCIAGFTYHMIRGDR